MDRTRKRGFALMEKADRVAAARRGGAVVPREKRTFSQNRDLAVAAGRVGGVSVAPENRSFSRNRELAIEAGRKGGAIAQERRRAAMKEAKCDI
jgi:general stress protein YciG